VANRGIHLQNAIDANQIPKEDRLLAAQLAVTPGASHPGLSATMFKPYPYNTSAQMTIWSHKGDNIYHSLQALYTLKLQRNSMLQTAYTWSKNLGDTTFGYVGTSTVFADNTNSRYNRGPVDFDRRHVLSANFIYHFPEFMQLKPVMRQAIGGWESSTIYNYASGNALTIQGSTGIGDPTGTATSGLFTGRPLRDFSQPCHSSNAPRDQWLNPAAFTWNGYQLGTFGNDGPGQCAGPPVNNVDYSIDKNWRISERFRLQFRSDFLNAFNRVNLAVPNTTVVTSTTGVIQASQPARNIQFALKLYY